MRVKICFTATLFLWLTSCQRPSDPAPGSPEHYLALAKETEHWLSLNTLDSESAMWPDAMDDPDKISTSYSDGMAGKLTFYLEMYAATQEAYYLERASAIGDYLLKNLPQRSDSLKGKFWAFSAFGEVCGPGFALAELYKVTGKETYQRGAESVVSVLGHFADHKQDTLSWDLGNDLLGGLSGTGLFLLYAHQELGSVEALEMAIRTGNTLLSRAILEQGGLTWKLGKI